MSSWFGGPSPSHRSRRDSEPKGYFVRQKSPSRRGSSPKRAFVRERARSGSRSPSRHGHGHGHGHGHRSEGGIGSLFGVGDERGRASPTRSIFSAVGSSRGLFGGGGGGGSSYYKRRPRDGYVSRLVHRIKRILRDLYRYARNNPVKLFMLVIMPLVTGGALHKVLQGMGVRLPAGLSRAMGGGRDSDRYGEHGGHGSHGGGGGLDLGQVMSVAKMFI